ncbi:TrmH family RNA methyltransferase [Coralliovum pocilloporae]|uniref:TrmH family RNA methyltransferase n=1 Tax=Coralliovum pocilloporae TaxID=3066369 RepID=UPI0033077B6C
MSEERPGLVKEITSLNNPLVKEIRALMQRKNREADGLFVTEGMKLVADAAEAGWPIRTLVYATKVKDHPLVEKLARTCKSGGGLVLEVTEAILSKITRRDNPQMVVGVFTQQWAELPVKTGESGDLWIALEGVKDPGNLGTVIRTADAVGARGVVLVGETTDPFGVEAVRATMGSIFHVPLAKVSVAEFSSWRSSWSGQLVGTHLKGAVDYRSVDYAQPTMLLMGNEQSGLPDNVAELCDKLILIPMAGKADSLNLAIATAVTAFEIRRNHLSL